MKLAIVCCLHGTEPYGLEVVKKLPASIPFFIGNEKALEENKRFIETDLNRCFPGNEFGSHEEKLAYGLCTKLRKFDYVIDLHSSSNSCPPFGIITNPTKEKIELSKKLGLKKLVIMKESIASGKALIDFVNCGISIEIGPHENPENIEKIYNLINNLVENKNYSENIEIYEVFKFLKREKKNVLIDNFEYVQSGQIISEDSTGKQLAEEDFTAILVNEDAYGDVLCLASKKINFSHD